VNDKDSQSVEAVRQTLETLLNDIRHDPNFWEKRLKAQRMVSQQEIATGLVFLGHGHSSLWSRVQLHLESDLHLKVEAWESVSRAGHHSIDVLKGLLKECSFAAFVITAEDSTTEGKVRARQNVIHEMGLFQGRVGFDKVALLEQEGVEEFSNIDGLQRIPFSGSKIEQSFYELDRMLKRECLVRSTQST
jgi:predicted nucleotide-binding protein